MKRWAVLILILVALGMLGCSQKGVTETKVTTTKTPTHAQTSVTSKVTPTVSVNTTIEDVENLINGLKELENINFSLE
ncbi:hypothetical protein [Archaeoglobus sp.]